MHAAKLLSLAIEAAKTAGFEVREEVLDGAGGGHCLIRGRKCLLLDMTQSHREQLNDVVDALRAEPQLNESTLHPMLAARLQEPLQKAA
jgi:Spy/CpxP family protein refolding chaperone